MTKNNYETIPFTNSIGQVINPGDPIVIVTTGYGHYVCTKLGNFLGMRGGKCVIVGDEKEMGLNYNGEVLTYNEYYRLPKEERALVKNVHTIVKRQRTLKRNRIFKIDIT